MSKEQLYICNHKNGGLDCHSAECQHNTPHKQQPLCNHNDICGPCHQYFKETVIKINAKICGYVGIALIALAYFLLNFKIVEINSYEYQICNLLAGILLYINAIGNKPFMLLEVFWSIVAIYQIIRMAVN